MSYISINEWRNKIKENKKIDISQIIYLMAFFMLLSVAMIKTTMLKVYLNSTFSQSIRLICMMLLSVKIFFIDRYKLKQLSAILIVEIIAVLIWRISGYSIIMELSLLIIGAKGIPFRNIVKTYLYVVLSVTIIAMISVKAGWIEHIIYSRDGKMRYSFGSIYCTDFAAHIFYMILAYCYLRAEKIKYISIMCFILLGCFTYYYCDARLDSICIFAVSVFCVIYKLINRFKKNESKSFVMKFIKKINDVMLILSVPLAALISIVPTMLYNPEISWMNKINKIFTYRLKFGKQGIDMYGFKLFGQEIKMVGNGGTNETIKDYFFIDSSFVSMSLRYGVILLFAICIYYMFVNYRLVKGSHYMLAFLIAFVAINSIVAHHFLDISYNPFLVCLFAKLDR